jgi:hypothetical protein
MLEKDLERDKMILLTRTVLVLAASMNPYDSRGINCFLDISGNSLIEMCAAAVIFLKIEESICVCLSD